MVTAKVRLLGLGCRPPRFLTKKAITRGFKAICGEKLPDEVRNRWERRPRSYGPTKASAICCPVVLLWPVAVWWYIAAFQRSISTTDVVRMTARRHDDDWPRDLASENIALRNDAISDLRDMLCRGLAKSLSKSGRIDDAFLEDVVQESCIKILEKLAAFEGRSKFRTWAVTIAVRTAVSKMRKRDWQNVSLESLTADADFDPQIAMDVSDTADQADSRSKLLNTLKDLIDSELTEKQWTAITAELGGMPLPQLAEKLGTNTNSIYKLLHDARKKLRRGLEASGFAVEDVHEAWA
jgi:RNA polymerase sigma-70 factor, ECF subfamily